MKNTPLASPRHTAIALLIVAAATLVGIRQASAMTAAGPAASRVIPYLSLIGLQLLWLRFINAGLKAGGHSMSELTGGRKISAHGVLTDLLCAALGFISAAAAATALSSVMGGVEARTAFLLPHGAAESALWVAVSITAGVSEEIVFRGYLQRQFAAMTGNTAAGILLQAVVFGVSHGYQGRASMATTGLYGLVFGVLAWWRGNVRASTVAHAATDIVGGLLRF